MLAKLLAAILGLMSFAVCLLGGLSVGARAEVAIRRGLQAMIVFCLLGWLIGWAAEAVVLERVRKERKTLWRWPRSCRPRPKRSSPMTR